MIIHNPKKIATVIVQRLKEGRDGGAPEMPEEEQEVRALSLMAQDLIAAIESKNADDVAAIMSAMVQQCMEEYDSDEDGE